MADTDFSRFVPGFDFLQGLMKNAGAAIPGFNQWVAPTLDPQELDKRIDELRTVQFWLENNARMLTATIQALEVQRMTLSTLHAMNVPMADLKDVLKTQTSAPRPASAAPAAPATPAAAKHDTRSDDGDQARSEAKAGTPTDAAGAESPPKPEPAGGKPAGADPLQWWNALTQQFTQVASSAMKSAQTAASAATAAATTAAATSTPAAKTTPKETAGPAAKPAATRSASTRSAAAKPAAKKAAPARKAAARRKTS